MYILYHFFRPPATDTVFLWVIIWILGAMYGTSCCKDCRRSRSRWSRSCRFFGEWWWIWPCMCQPPSDKTYPTLKNKMVQERNWFWTFIFSPIFVGPTTTNSLGTTSWWLPPRKPQTLKGCSELIPSELSPYHQLKNFWVADFPALS